MSEASGVRPGHSGVLEWSAIWRAAVTTCTFALPVGLLQQYLLDDDQLQPSDPINLFFYLVIFFCGALGGYAAAKLVDHHPLQNGAAAAGLATLAILAGGFLRRSIAGREIDGSGLSLLLGWAFLALLMSTFGMLGARVHRSTHSPGDSPRRSSGAS